MYQPSEKLQKQVDDVFVYHAPQGSQTERYTMLRKQAHEFACLIITNVPPSRELSMALTRLQEVMMFCNAAIAINEKWSDDGKLFREIQPGVFSTMTGG